MKNMKTNLEVIKECLTQKEWKFLCDDEDGFIAVGFNDAGITFRVSEEQVEVQMCFFKEIPEEAYREVSEYLNKVNLILTEGHFEVEHGKSFSYRITSSLEEGITLQSVQVMRMLDACCRIGGQLGAEVYRIIDGE